jgi:hypothetical protein
MVVMIGEKFTLTEFNVADESARTELTPTTVDNATRRNAVDSLLIFGMVFQAALSRYLDI